MQGYITIKQASLLTGKHPDTIRRLIKENTGTKNVAKDRKGRFIVNSEWLVTYFEPSEAPTSPDNSQNTEQTAPHSQTSLEPVINALTSQLNAKDQQIANLQALLSEKEANTTKLQDQFQQLLARQQLPTGNDNSQPPEPTYAEPTQTEVKTTQAKPKPARRTSKQKPKPVTTNQAKSKPKKPAKSTAKEQPSITKPKKRWWGRS